MRRNEIGGLHWTQRNYVFIRATIVHDTDAFHRQINSKRLRDLVVPAHAVFIFSGAWFFDKNYIGATQ
jgi:hypothetical protein